MNSGAQVYLAVEKVRTTRQLIQCTVDVTDGCLRVNRPFVIKSSIHLFVEQWERVNAGESLSVYSVAFSNMKIVHKGSAISDEAQIEAKLSRSGSGELLSPCKAFDLETSARKQPSAGRSAGLAHAEADDNEAEDLDYGQSLLAETLSLASAASTSAHLEAAAAASLAEAERCEGQLDDELVDSMVKRVTDHIDVDLNVMQAVEQGLLQRAVSEKVVSAADIQADVDELCASGMSPEEAVTEAVLNSSKMIGNTDLSEQGGGSRACSSSAAAPPAATATDADVHTAPMSARQHAQRAFVTLCAAVNESIRSILICLFERAKQSETLAHDAVSLVLNPADVEGDPSFRSSRRLVLIKWEVPWKTGRVVRVDEAWRAISMVCIGRNRYARNFEASSLILPHCGLTLQRVSKAQRPMLPPHVIRVAKMLLQLQQIDEAEAQQDAMRQDCPEQMGQLLIPSEECVYCGCLGQQESLARGTSSESSAAQSQSEQTVQTCPLCLLSWHDSCAEKFLLDHQPLVMALPSVPGMTAGSAPQLHQRRL